MTAVEPVGLLDDYAQLALAGRAGPAIALALRMLDEGQPAGDIIGRVLAPAQRAVGDSWHRDEIGVGEEHVATGVTHAVLHALGDATPEPTDSARVVVACAEGDWHGIAAHMLAEQLRAKGLTVAFLGASTPAGHLGGFLDRYGADALAVSCNLPIFSSGLARLADAAHGVGVPVLAGGRGLGSRADRALRLGADGWAPDADTAAVTLAGWRDRRPAPRPLPTFLDPEGAALERRAGELADRAMARLQAVFPRMASYRPDQLDRTREDLTSIVQFTAAAQLVDDPGVLTDFLDWLAVLLRVRHVPGSALRSGLEVLRPLLHEAGVGPGHLADIGVDHLSRSN